jgi:hypothetical protein
VAPSSRSEAHDRIGICPPVMPHGGAGAILSAPWFTIPWSFSPGGNKFRTHRARTSSPIFSACAGPVLGTVSVVSDERTTRHEGLDDLVARLRETVAEQAPAQPPPTDAPRKIPTRDLHEIEEIDEVTPVEERPAG